MDRNQRMKKYTKLAGTAIFMGLVAVVQMFVGVITIGTVNLNFVLLPIIVAGILFGKASSSLCGITFGVCVFIQCLTGQQGAFGATLVESNIFYTFIATIIRGFLIGYLTTLIYEMSYRIISKKRKTAARYIAFVIAGAVAPIINTALFIVMLFLLFNGFVYSSADAEGVNTLYFLFIGLAGVNFIIELISSLILTPPLSMALLKAKKSLDGEK